MIRWPWRRRAKPLGAQGEDLAAKHLAREGYEILERNLKLGRYEIDIVAREGDTIVFVEVKTLRKASEVYRPEGNVTREKQRHLIAAANHYITTRRKAGVYCRFDVVSVVLPEAGKPEITLFRDAFQA